MAVLLDSTVAELAVPGMRTDVRTRIGLRYEVPIIGNGAAGSGIE